MAGIYVCLLYVCILRHVDVSRGAVDVFFFQAEDGIRFFCLSRGLGDVYKGQL